MNGGQLIGLIAVTGAMIIAAGAVIGGLWASVRTAEFRTRRLELEVGLKQDMLNRGMPVEEIERVLAAGQASSPADSSDAAQRAAGSGRCL
jgi:hypothetical protein